MEMDEITVTLVRSFIAFTTLLLFTRILGKQQVGQLTAFEYIAGITIGSAASSLSIDLSTKPLPQFMGLTTWVVLVLVLQQIALKSRRFAKVTDDQPTIIVQQGKILEDNLNKIRLRYDDLMSLLRDKDVFDISQVQYALLEPNGNLSVLKRPEYDTPTLKDLNIPASVSGIFTEVILDGVIIEQNLKNKNKTLGWLYDQLKANGVSSIKEISYAAIMPNGQLYIDKFDDKINETDIGDFNGPF